MARTAPRSEVAPVAATSGENVTPGSPPVRRGTDASGGDDPGFLKRLQVGLGVVLVAIAIFTVVDVRLGRAVTAIEPDRVDDVPCDLVLLAAGIRPNCELACDAGIERGRTGAIAVDERMETNLPGVYAAGDCAEVRHLVTVDG